MTKVKCTRFALKCESYLIAMDLGEVQKFKFANCNRWQFSKKKRKKKEETLKHTKSNFVFPI